MPRPIDADKLLALVKMNAPFIYSILGPIVLLCPTMEPEPMEWLSPAKPDAEAWRECSACGAEVEGIAFPFCPYCGRKARNGVGKCQG